MHPEDVGQSSFGTGMNFNEHLEEINLAEFDTLCAQLFKLRELADAKQKEADDAKALLEVQKAKVLAILEKSGKEKFFVDGMGTIYTQNRFTVTMPKDPMKKKEFMAFLESKGLKDDLMTVHSQTLNSFYKQEMDAAIQEGNSDFKIPGLDEPKLVKTLAMRKG